MTNFLKSQQAKASEKLNQYHKDFNHYEGDEQYNGTVEEIIAQTIKDTTARVREVLGEEIEVNKDGSRHEVWETFGHNTLKRKVTQELDNLEE